MRRCLCMLLCLMLGALAACGSNRGSNDIAAVFPHGLLVDSPEASPMLTANIFTGDALASMLVTRLGSGAGILATSFVELDDLDASSAFGRLSSQQIASRLGQHGYRVLDIRLGTNMRVDVQDGEFMLSRDSAKLMADSYDAAAVLVGSYTRSGGLLFVTARAIALTDSTVLASYEYSLPADATVTALLRRNNTASGRDDPVWQRHALRQGVGATGPAAADGDRLPVVRVPQRSQPAPAAGAAGPARLTLAGGVRIDPNSPPMPFPPGSRRNK